jgi:predicted transposase/invertase (TIGR01784 family)
MVTEQIGMGGHYNDLKQAVSIVITDYDFIPESARCHTVFQMLEREEHFPFNDLMEIHVLNLERLPEDEEGKLADWLRFLKAETEEEFKMVAEKNPMIQEAYCKLQVMSEDEANRIIYEARLKAQRDDYSRMNGAHQKGLHEGLEKGLEKGREEGREEGQKEIILRMVEHGMTNKDIADVTHLSEQQINNILRV